MNKIKLTTPKAKLELVVNQEEEEGTLGPLSRATRWARWLS